MKPAFKPLVAFFMLAAAFGFMSFISRPNPASRKTAKHATPRKIQAAILLDVSNSMDGLIEQAKAQLWNMVSVMGKAKCDNDVVPQVEIALYEYGRSTNDVTAGYVKQISPFTTDLDKLSNDLFSLTTNGGDEYCGQVIFTSLQDLKWDNDANDYKVIFIAGNEDFLQGKLHYTKACTEAKNKGVVVNTIYCGSKADGIREHWNLNAECGTGSFTNINSDAKIEEIPTPYDSILYTLNDKLNSTYIAYGYAGATKKALQTEMDQKNYAANQSAAVKRVAVKGRSSVYRNESWDLVDRAANASPEEKKVFYKSLDKNTLPDSLRNKSSEELIKVVAVKQQERSNIQQEIEKVNNQREAYIAEQRKKNAVRNTDATLETEVEKIIREQAKRYNMKIN